MAVDRRSEDALFSAVQTGDVGRVHQLLAQGVNVNVRDHHGCTPLMRAAETGHIAVVQLLLDAGSDVLLVDPHGQRAIFYTDPYDAIETATVIGRAMGGKASQAWLNDALVFPADGDIAWVHGLLAAGADPNGMPLIMAIQCDEISIVQALIGAGADVNRTFGDTTPLIHAVTACYPAIVRVLIDAGADVNLPDKAGRTPVQAAKGQIRSNTTPIERLALIQLLKDAGARE